MKKPVIQILCFAAMLGSACAAELTDLRCEYRTEPLGIDALKPRLSWILCSPRRGESQSAYQVLVATSPELLVKDQGDLWDSGKVVSDAQNQIEYAGRALQSRTVCFWKVRVWDGDGKAGGWSKATGWSMGLLNAADWQAKWIGVEQLPPAERELSILVANFQAVNGSAKVDVTARLNAMIKKKQLSLKTDLKTLSPERDPAPSVKKELVIEYALGGERQPRVSFPENQAIMLGGSGEWATPGYLRKSFALKSVGVRRATVYATALGLYELHLNGKRVGDHLLAPEWTNYHRRVQYQSFDVTSMVRPGENALSAALANGWYSGGWQHWKSALKSMYGSEPFFLAQLEIEFADGSRQTVVSDHSWRGTIDGPLRFAGIYEGESYDATREMPGWDGPDFDDATWVAAKPASADLKVGQLVWQRGEPIRATREIKPVSVTEVKPGVHVFAFDQNMAGRCRFTFRGKPGQTLEFQHGEMRNADGTVFLGNLLVVSKHRIQLDRYTFRGDGIETFEPRFTYHGFQYVEVRGLSEKPPLESVVGVVFNSDCREVGQFTCSEPLLNRLAENIVWSQRSNYMGVPTDCPQRNERCGYTGDANFFMRAAVYNMDVAAFFNRWLVDLCQDAQLPAGHFADHAPTFGPGDGPNVGWSDGGIICPYEIWRNYGDTRVIREHYGAMKRKLEYLAKNSKEELFTGKVGNGDWLSNQGGTSKAVIGTAFSGFNFRLMAEMAEAIGEKEDAARFRERAGRIGEAFAKAHIEPNGAIKASSQSGYALAFTMGLVPPPLKEAMSARFIEEMEKFDWHPRTGFIGTPRLLPALHIAGRDDAAYKVLLTKSAPSWLYPVTIGATTIWENWAAWDGKNPQGGMNSLNHYSFGAVGEYLFGMIGGIQPAAPGFREIEIAPVIREGLTWANTRYDSIRGRIVSNWKLEGARLTMDVSIPPNSSALVHVPCSAAEQVTEGGGAAASSKGVTFLKVEGGASVYRVGAGTYQFQMPIKP